MAKFDTALTTLLEQFRNQGVLPGYDIAVWQDGKEIYRQMAGYADLATATPITGDTLYNLYSNTKVIACTAALQLYEQGLFLLEDPMHLYFPEFSHMKVRTPDGGVKDAENVITIRDLFRMTAGFGDGSDFAEIGKNFQITSDFECTATRLTEALATIPLLFEPGTQYKYGICHEVLAALVEKFSGERFSEYLERHIFRPLGMNNTAFSLDKLENKALANQYQYVGGEEKVRSLGPANFLVPPILKESASGGLISTVDDYMKFQQALCQGEQLLSRRTIDLMRLDQLSGTQRDGYSDTPLGVGYGLGVRTIIDQARCGSPIGFGPFGWGGASGSYGSIDPENKLCFFYMQHTFGLGGFGIHPRIRNIIYSHLD